MTDVGPKILSYDELRALENLFHLCKSVGMAPPHILNLLVTVAKLLTTAAARGEDFAQERARCIAIVDGQAASHRRIASEKRAADAPCSAGEHDTMAYGIAQAARVLAGEVGAHSLAPEDEAYPGPTDDTPPAA